MFNFSYLFLFFSFLCFLACHGSRSCAPSHAHTTWTLRMLTDCHENHQEISFVDAPGFCLQADFCTRCLNELQAIFGLPPQPQLRDFEKPAKRHTLAHLESWFDDWLAFYELMPSMIHPRSPAFAGSADGSDSGAGDNSGGDENAQSETQDAADAAAAEQELASNASADGASDADTGEQKGDRRIKLSREEAEKVRVTLSWHKLNCQLGRCARGIVAKTRTMHAICRCQHTRDTEFASWSISVVQTLPRAPQVCLHNDYGGQRTLCL